MNITSDIHDAISLRNLAIGYRGVPLFEPVSLDIPAGTLNVIVGANGSGKSTLLHTIGGNIPPVGGSVFLNGKDAARMGRRRLARTLSLVYTERLIAGGLTVRELVDMGRNPYTGFTGRLSAEDRDIVNRAIADAGIEAKADSFLSDVSDGERQKAMIARALAQQTPVMLLDEPTNFLDAASRLELLSLIQTLVRDKGITVLLSTHDTATALPIADKVITVLPDAKPPVACTPAGSRETIARLDRVFADRGIRFDTLRGDFILGDR